MWLRIELQFILISVPSPFPGLEVEEMSSIKLKVLPKFKS